MAKSPFKTSIFDGLGVESAGTRSVFKSPFGIEREEPEAPVLGPERPSRVPQLQAAAEEAESFAQSQSGFGGITKNTLKALPGQGFNIAKDIAQSPFRSAGALALSAIGEDEVPLQEGAAGVVQQILFGKEPIRSIAAQGEQAANFGKELGVSENVADKLGVPLAVGGILMDFIPGGGATDDFLKSLAKNTDPKIIKSILKEAKFTDDVIEGVTKNISKATEPKQVEKIIEDMFEKTPGLNSVKKNIQNTAPRTVPDVDPKTGKVTQRVFRTDKLNLGPDEILDVEKRLDTLGLRTKSVRSFDDMQQAAQDLGFKNVDELLKPAKRPLSDVEVVSLRNFITSKFDQLRTLNLKNPIDEDAIRSNNIAIQNVDNEINQALKKLNIGSSETGRALVAHRIEAQTNLDPAYWLKRAEQILNKRVPETLTRKPVPVEVKNAIQDLVDKGDFRGLATLVQGLETPSKTQQLLTLWKAGLLTSPTTHIVNVGGNALAAALNTASDVAATSLDVLISLARGSDRTITITPGTVKARLRGFKKGIGDAKEFSKTGIYSEDLLSKYNVASGVTFENKYLNGYTESVFRSLGAEDIVFRRAAMEESLEKSATVMAKNEGLVGKRAKSRIRELLMKPTNEMVAKSIDDAERATFQKKNVLSDAVNSLKGFKYVGATVDFFVPFTKTPINIAEMVMDFSPAGFFRAVYRAANRGVKKQAFDQLDFVERFGKAATGTSVIAFGAWMASKGLMTGNVPDDPDERNDFFASGRKEQAIRIGDTWVGVGRFAPIGNLLVLGAEMYENSQNNEGFLKNTLLNAAGGVETLSEQTFVAGVKQAVDLFSDPSEEAPKFASQTSGSLVPSVIGKVTYMIDPTMRVSDGVLEGIQKRLPGISSSLPPRVDVFGREVEASGGRVAIVDPFAMTKDFNDPILKEAARLDITIGLPDKTINGIKLDTREYSVYAKAQGKELQKRLDAVISSEEYKNASAEQQVDLIKSTKSKSRRDVKEALFPALMVRRFELPETVNPHWLMGALRELGTSDKFKKANDKKKANVLNAFIDQNKESSTPRA